MIQEDGENKTKQNKEDQGLRQKEKAESSESEVKVEWVEPLKPKFWRRGRTGPEVFFLGWVC